MLSILGETGKVYVVFVNVNSWPLVPPGVISVIAVKVPLLCAVISTDSVKSGVTFVIDVSPAISTLHVFSVIVLPVMSPFVSTAGSEFIPVTMVNSPPVDGSTVIGVPLNTSSPTPNSPIGTLTNATSSLLISTPK